MEAAYNHPDRFEWVELLEPSSQKVIFANLESGEIRWDSPPNARVKPLANEQWWELFDVNTQRHYYHNVRTGRTEWNRPSTGDVIPLSNLQLLKQFASSDSTMDKSAKGNTKTLDIGVMHRHKVPSTGGGRNSVHMVQQDRSKIPASGTPCATRHPISTGYQRQHPSGTPNPDRPVPHRRRNSQPTRSTASVTSSPSIQQTLTRSAGENMTVAANQRVTEWLRSAGSLPEEVEDDALPHQRPSDGPAVNSATPQPRWHATRGVTTAMFQAHLPPVTRHHFPAQPAPPTTAAVPLMRPPTVMTTAAYDRRVVSMVPTPPPPPMHGHESAFTNLLYDMSCNVVPQQLPTGMAALALTPRPAPRTNVHAVAGTMPRLSGPFAKPPPSQQQQQPVKNGNAANGASSPDTEITTNSSASMSSYSGDSDAGSNEADAASSARDAPTYSKEDIFEQHPFRPNTVLPVDEYTFTVPRQQAVFQSHQQLSDGPSGWALSQPQPASAMLVDDLDQAPPTPPPRLASAMNTMHFSRGQQSAPADGMAWQNCEVSATSGFLPRCHPLRQPKKLSSCASPTLNSVVSADDDTSEDPAVIHTSTRSLISASSSTHEAAGTGNAPTSSLHPRRSASGGFIGPADAEVPPSTTATKSTLEQAAPCTITSGTTHFALISGPYSWPKDLLRQGQDRSTLMSWTKAAFSKRILAATDKSLLRHLPENFKLIQSFMGDRAAKLSKPDLASIIIQRAITTPGVRDELYAQLCKQTTGNYNADSLMRGWELLCICLYFFPPNKVFRDPLHAYLTARCEALSIGLAPSGLHTSSTASSSVAESTAAIRPGPSLAAAAALAAGSDPAALVSAPITPSFGVPLTNGDAGGDANSVEPSDAPSSEFPYGPWVKLSALHFTRAAPRWFMRSVAVGPSRLPMPLSKEELLHVKDFLLKPGIFGSSLEEMLKIQSCRFPSLRLPWIQVFLTEELLRLKGAKAEGIFRVSADQDILTAVRFQLEKLFEVFRVVEVTSRDAAPTYAIVRPPPRGWSQSQLVFAPEGNDVPSANPTLPRSPLLECPALTGAFELPLKPTPISPRPAEYMLLTPRAVWPGDLGSFGESSNADENSAFLDPHLSAALLKLWLREMATPLVPPGLTAEVFSAAVEADAFEKAAVRDGNQVSHQAPIDKCCATVRRLPRTNRRVLLYLIKLCQYLARPENASASLMDSRNLATVIAPNLFRSTTNNPSEMLNSVQSQTAFVRLLICHLNVDAEADLLNSEEEAASATATAFSTSSSSR
uniref:Rho GTPase-activating protein 39 n=2 Tax=Mesocestoides corti TaxID=53468 RepID=A0A5K3F2S6_MESCO